MTRRSYCGLMVLQGCNTAILVFGSNRCGSSEPAYSS